MMMNVVAISMLFSTLGAANLIFPEYSAVTTSEQHIEQPLQLSKQAAKESLHYAVEAAKQTGENIHQKVVSASHIPEKAAEAVQHYGRDVAQAVKDGSQLGLEKIGLAQPRDLKRRGEGPLIHEAEIIKEEVGNAHEGAKDAAGETVEASKGKAREAATAFHDKVEGLKDWLKGGAHATKNSVEETGAAAKEEVSNAAQYGHDKVSDGVKYVGGKASGVKHSVQDNIHAAEDKACETADCLKESARRSKDKVVGFTYTAQDKILAGEERLCGAAGSACEHATDCIKESAGVTKDKLAGISHSVQDNFHGAERRVGETAESAYEHCEECVKASSQKAKNVGERIKHAAEDVAHTIQDRVKEAVTFLPNVGQGLAFKNEETHAGWKDRAYDKASDAVNKEREAVSQAQDSVVDGAKQTAEKISDVTQQTKEEAGRRLSDAKDETVSRFHDARDNLADFTDDSAQTAQDRVVTSVEEFCYVAGGYFLSTCRVAHLFAFSAVYGSSLWITFLSGYLLSHSIPRQQFGFVQSRIFPAYLRVVSVGQAVCLVLFLILHPWASSDREEKLQHLDLWAVLMSTLTNTFFFEPRATKAMFEKLKVEKEEGRGQDGLKGLEDDETKTRLANINSTFAAFHGYSSIANLFGLIGMTWHLWHLSRGLSV